MTSGSAYEFETGHGFSVVRFNQALTECRWGDIEQVGTELGRKLDEQPVPDFVVDISGLDFIGSAAVALIVKLWKRGQERQGQMVVVNARPIIREVLEIAGLTRVWTIVETRAEAVALLDKTPTGPSTQSSFLLALLGWLSAAGAAGMFLAGKKELIAAAPETIRTTATGGACLALALGLFTVIHEKRAWRGLGVLLVLVAAGLLVAVFLS